jgi:hypothetical protein
VRTAAPGNRASLGNSLPDPLNPSHRADHAKLVPEDSLDPLAHLVHRVPPAFPAIGVVTETQVVPVPTARAAPTDPPVSPVPLDLTETLAMMVSVEPKDHLDLKDPQVPEDPPETRADPAPTVNPAPRDPAVPPEMTVNPAARDSPDSPEPPVSPVPLGRTPNTAHAHPEAAAASPKLDVLIAVIDLLCSYRYFMMSFIHSFIANRFSPCAFRA